MMQYDKWRRIETHADDGSDTALTKGMIVGYRLVRLMDGKEIRTDKVAKHGTMVKGIVKRSGGKPALFLVKDGLVTNDEYTGEYEMIGVGLIMKRRTETLARNMERGEAHMMDLKDYSTTIRDDAHHCLNNCPVDVSGQLLDPDTGGPMSDYEPMSSCVYDSGSRKQVGLDYGELPDDGKIVPLTFVIGPTTVADVVRGVMATTPGEPDFEKIPS
jgi:hypothetical protein